MALLAGNAGVLAFQFVARQPVIELLLGGLPMDQAEVFSVMIQMATNTISSIGVGHLELEVITVLGREPLGDFLVAIQALESRNARPKLMAARALRGSRQRLMSFGERAGRDLCVCKTHGQKRGKKEKEKAPQPRRSKPYAEVTSDIRLAEDQDVLRLSNLKQLLRAW